MTATKDRQVKFQLERYRDIRDKLIESRAIFLSDTHEKTVLYDYENGKLAKKGLFIRTKSGMDNLLTMKEKPKNASKTLLDRRKIELEIEDVNDLEYIFTKIGLTNKRIMEKYRITWSLDGTIINIDELPFGIFLEIKGNEKDVRNVKRLLNLSGNAITVTYWDLNDKINGGKKNIRFHSNHMSKIFNVE